VVGSRREQCVTCSGLAFCLQVWSAMASRRVVLMAVCRKCGRRFSTGIRTDADSPYRVKGWTQKCPHCATEHTLDSEDLQPAPILPPWQPTL